MVLEIGPEAITVKVLTISDRSFAGSREDMSGPAAAGMLRDAGYGRVDLEIVPDGSEAVESALREAIAAGVDLVLTLGGTGVGPRDETPEGTRPIIETELPGISEGLRRSGEAAVSTAILSRGVAGVTAATGSGHRTLVVNLPGSTGGARDGIAYLMPVLPHLVAQLRGGDH